LTFTRITRKPPPITVRINERRFLLDKPTNDCASKVALTMYPPIAVRIMEENESRRVSPRDNPRIRGPKICRATEQHAGNKNKTSLLDTNPNRGKAMIRSISTSPRTEDKAWITSINNMWILHLEKSQRSCLSGFVPVP
jgi:hypothetical protein